MTKELRKYSLTNWQMSRAAVMQQINISESHFICWCQSTMRIKVDTDIHQLISASSVMIHKDTFESLFWTCDISFFRIISLWGPFRGRYRSTCLVVLLTLSMRSCWTPNFPPYPCEALGMVSNSFCFRLVCSVDTVSRSRWMLCRGRTEWSHTFKSFLRWI